MKGLNGFLKFDITRFLAHKELTVTGCRSWKDGDKTLGTKVEVAITRDDTDYGDKKDISNLYEKFFVKVAKDISFPVGTAVELVNPTGTVYGDYRNQLSVRADDVTEKAGKGHV